MQSLMFVADVCTAHVWFHGMDYARVCRTVDVWRCEWHSLYHCTVIVLYYCEHKIGAPFFIFWNVSLLIFLYIK